MLTPGLAEERHAARPMAGSNDAVFGGMFDPAEQVRRDVPESGDGFFKQILARERELAKLRIRAGGENVRTVIEIGDVHFLSKRFTRARDTYLRATRLDKNNVAVYRKLVNCYIALGDFRQASEAFERLVELSPTPEFKHDYIMFRLATRLGDAQEVQSIENDIRQLAEEHSTSSPILNTYGIVLLLVAKEGDARKYFEKAVAQDKSNFHAINNLGIIYKNEKQFDKALHNFNLAISLGQKYSAAYENIASVFIEQEKYEEALSDLRGAEEDGVMLSDLWSHKIGWLLIRLERYEEAIKWHKERIEREPDNEHLLTNLGFCYQVQGKTKEAEKKYEAAIEQFESKLPQQNYIADIRSFLAYENLMSLANSLGKTNLVDSTAKRLLAIYPQDAMALYFRGKASLKTKNYTFAKECYEESIKQNPNAVDPYIDLSFIYETIDQDFAKAIELLENAPFKKTTYSLVANNLAYAYIKNGDLAKADKLLNSADLKDKSHPSLEATRGLAQLYKDNLKKAETYYSKAIKALDTKDGRFAEQVWDYEQALYWANNENYDLASKKLEDALGIGDASYAYVLANQLKKKIKAEAKQAQPV